MPIQKTTKAAKSKAAKPKAAKPKAAKPKAAKTEKPKAAKTANPKAAKTDKPKVAKPKTAKTAKPKAAKKIYVLYAEWGRAEIRGVFTKLSDAKKSIERLVKSDNKLGYKWVKVTDSEEIIFEEVVCAYKDEANENHFLSIVWRSLDKDPSVPVKRRASSSS